MKDYFFCYNPKLARFLRHEKDIEYIIKAKHTNTDKIFYLFEQSKELSNGINEYKKISKSGH